MKKYKYTIIGAFDFISFATGGQPVKTRETFYALSSHYGKERVKYIETLDWRKNPIKLIRDILHFGKHSEYVLMMPARNGMKVFSFILVAMTKLRNVKLIYSVIGGWLYQVIKDDKLLIHNLKQFDSIWVETSLMKSDLESLGFRNVKKVNNFKKLEVLSDSELVYSTSTPLRLVMFSRIMKEKGVEDAITAIQEINNQLGHGAFTIDLYGPIDDSFKKSFENICISNPQVIKYCGVVPPNDSVKYLKDYYALLFPTHFFTEGIPGTIIDAYAAGVPVIAAQWQHVNDVVTQNVTGLTYKFNDFTSLKEALMYCFNFRNEINSMKINCLNKATEYLPEYFLKTIND